jgi:hypothetical protein
MTLPLAGVSAQVDALLEDRAENMFKATYELYKNSFPAYASDDDEARCVLYVPPACVVVVVVLRLIGPTDVSPTHYKHVITNSLGPLLITPDRQQYHYRSLRKAYRDSYGVTAQVMDAVSYSGTATDYNIAEKGCLCGRESLYTQADLTQPGSVEKSIEERRTIRWDDMRGVLDAVKEEYEAMYGVGGMEENADNLTRCLQTVDLCMNMFDARVFHAVQERVLQEIEGEWNTTE